MPTDKQLVEFALVVCEGKIDVDKLTDMVTMTKIVLQRIKENNDIKVPCKQEIKDRANSPKS